MFIVSLSYLVELEQVDRFIPAHLEWLEQNYTDGVFLASGRKVPRTGGVILASGLNRAELDARLAEDPFSVQGIAEYAVIEFEPNKVREGVSLG
ncbi:YciI family protein [Psychromicrobium sp. YIM B11713]|uniref:YciI family protein n=1 Tax=Psychromicrobium sp. YIM B11713 TaxID=3145233 RepID=UPI00374F7582